MKHLLPFVMVCFLISCDKTNYSITGKLSSDGFNGQTVYLSEYSSDNPRHIDSAVVVKNSFVFRGKVEHPIFVMLTAKNNEEDELATFFVENADIDLSIDLNSRYKTIASGSKLNDLHCKYMSGGEEIIKKFDELSQYAQTKEMSDEFNDELLDKHNQINDEYIAYSVKFAEENPGTLLTAYVLLTAYEKMSSENLQKAFDLLDENAKNSGLGKLIMKIMERMNVPELAVGQDFRDLKMKTPDDREMSISDYAGKGKYVLLDFWASWCGPCRQENPNVAAMYEKYRNRDFEIIGISLDKDKNAWIKAITDDKITWLQMSDLKGAISEAATTYKIKGVPFTVLLDKDGKIVDMNLGGVVLENKLKEIFPD